MDADNILIGAGTIEIDGTDIGYTKGGVKVSYKRSMVDVEADQAAGVVRKARSLERAMISFNLLEVSLEQLRIAMMQPSGNLVGDTLTVGYDNGCWVDEHEIVITGPAPGCTDRVFTFPRCVSEGDVDYEMKRDSETAVQMQFEAMKDTDGVLYTVEDAA
jgi:hypothetical protein